MTKKDKNDTKNDEPEEISKWNAGSGSPLKDVEQPKSMRERMEEARNAERSPSKVRHEAYVANTLKANIPSYVVSPHDTPEWTYFHTLPEAKTAFIGTAMPSNTPLPEDNELITSETVNALYEHIDPRKWRVFSSVNNRVVLAEKQTLLELIHVSPNLSAESIDLLQKCLTFESAHPENVRIMHDMTERVAKGKTFIDDLTRKLYKSE